MEWWWNTGDKGMAEDRAAKLQELYRAWTAAGLELPELKEDKPFDLVAEQMHWELLELIFEIEHGEDGDA